MSNNYLDTVNKEIKQYCMIACDNDYPAFINKYIATKELQRLKGIGQFCGSDYTKLYNLKYWYSRLDHSVICALMAWHFTKDKKQTLAALFHDLGTPAFSHCIDFMLGDSINQESAEKSVYDLLSKSIVIKKYLAEDDLTIEDVTDLNKYTIIENKKPKLCVDRLDGILHTVLIWIHTWSIDEVKEVYNDIEVLTNEDNELEIGFKDLSIAQKFFEAMYQYSIAVQENRNKFTLQYIADNLKVLINKRLIIFDDLYDKSELEIINIITCNNKNWSIFANSNHIEGSNEEPKSKYYVSTEAKKRYANPLCCINGNTCRLCDISSKSKQLLDQYLNHHEAKYAYVEGLNIEWEG